MNTPRMREVRREAAPKLAAFRDEITQNRGPLRAHRARSTRRARPAGLNAEQQRLAYRHLHHASCAPGRGAAAADKHRPGGDQPAPRRPLHPLQPEHPRRRGRPRAGARERGRSRRPARQGLIAAAAADGRGARAGGQVGGRQHPLGDGAVPHLLRPPRPAREGLRACSPAAATTAASTTTTPIITEILELRAERAQLLGYPTFAHWVADGQMAKTPEAAMALMTPVWGPAVARSHEEVAEMQAARRPPRAERADRALGLPLLRREGAQGEVRPRRERGEALPAAREAARGHVLGRRRALRAEVRAGETTCRSTTRTSASSRSTRDGQRVGLWYFDPYARAGKSSGAWMNEYRTQQRLGGRAITPIVSNNANFIPASAGRARA